MNPPIRVSDVVADAVQGRWGARGKSWIQAVEGELAELSVTRGARPYRVLPSRYSYVVVAETEDGDLIMRATPDPAALDQIAVTRMLAECHAGPAVHEVITTETGVWTLMERVVPGGALADAAQGSVTLDDLADLFRAISQSRADVADLPRLADWLTDRLDSDVLTDIPTGQTAAPSSERLRARSLLAELDAATLRDSLCHGDAHPGNFLISAGTHKVLLVDPRGLRGDVAYDIGVLALKLNRYNLSAACDLACDLASLAGSDGNRAAAWAEVAQAARV
jgi:streptomycin 6-kinase